MDGFECNISFCAGGHKLKSQRDGLAEGADVVVGTPGRLCELIKAQDLLLDNCSAVVLDEVDVLLGGGSLFQEQVSLSLALHQNKSVEHYFSGQGRF